MTLNVQIRGDLDVTRLAKEYDSARHVLLPGFVSPEWAANMLAATQDVVAKRVKCRTNIVSWEEQIFIPGHPMHQFFARADMMSLMQAVVGVPCLKLTDCWTSCYQRGEYIEPHTDGRGTTQLLICLQTTAGPECGGELVVANQRYFLKTGDAIGFEATTLEHSTTPLQPTPQEPNPRRVVLVGRYLAELDEPLADVG
jgi:hypothetical protein